MTTNQLSAGLAALALAGVSLPLVLQHQTIAGLRAENQALEERLLPLAELEAIRAENRRLASLQINANELDEWRRSRPELMRLRGEVGLLRNQLGELQAVNAGLRDELDEARDRLDRSLAFSRVLKREEWQDQGVQNPIHALETMLWGWQNGQPAALHQAVLFPDNLESEVDRERFLRSLLPREQPPVTRSDRVNIFWHSGDSEQTVRTITALERYVFVDRPEEYRENLVAWDLVNLDGDWKIMRKRPFVGIDPEEHPAWPGPTFEPAPAL